MLQENFLSVCSHAEFGAPVGLILEIFIHQSYYVLVGITGN